MSKRRHASFTLDKRTRQQLNSRKVISSWRPNPVKNHDEPETQILQKIAGLASGLVGGTRRPLFREEGAAPSS
ncbi:hypothetical protein FHS20_001457 [Phyllobacterium endophyticum]|uniref:Uncharacterized protein n=1 Tax=Phyllobacterium endophyticum TaxID=1149773 RepID=A0A2P7AV47_9HYPH|nr:hypothetical protein [Phyllobacterium endophyticum]PSH58086.1 hypothetical protein CU100_10560 [Phyllobacterium endophyticum]